MCVQFTLNNKTMIRSIYGAPCPWYRCAGQEDIFLPLHMVCAASSQGTTERAVYLPYVLDMSSSRERWSPGQDSASLCKDIPDTNYTTIVSALYSNFDQPCRPRYFRYRPEVSVTASQGMNILESIFGLFKFTLDLFWWLMNGRCY